MAPAIETDGLSKRYGSTVAVRDLDLAVPRGDIYGFLGPNGAGKTTTIRMLTTLTSPSGGEAYIAGESVTDRAAVVDELGFLPETPPVYGELTGREQLEYIAGLREFDDWERIESLLERFDLAEDADRRIDTYSKGMKQKLGLVQALMHRPAVVFLDEPTSGLDPRAARTVRDIIAEVAREDTTIFLSTHILPVVEELADTVGVLYDGRLVAEGSPAELTDRVEAGSTLEDVFLEVTEELPDDGGSPAAVGARDRPDRDAESSFAPTDDAESPATAAENGPATPGDEA